MAKAASVSEPVIEVEDLEGLEKVLKENKFVVLDCWAPWCGPCKRAMPLFKGIAEVNEEITFAKVNVDEADDFQEKYSVTSLPTFIVFKEESETTRVVGMDFNAIKKALEEEGSPEVTLTEEAIEAAKGSGGGCVIS